MFVWAGGLGHSPVDWTIVEWSTLAGGLEKIRSIQQKLDLSEMFSCRCSFPPQEFPKHTLASLCNHILILKRLNKGQKTVNHTEGLFSRQTWIAQGVIIFH